MNASGSLWSVFRLLLPPLVLLIGVGGLYLLAASREQPQPREYEPPLPLVETVPVSQTSGGDALHADGVVVPYREITLAAQVEGRVVSKSEACRPSRTVTAGQELLRIDPQDYELTVARLQQEKSQALASVQELSVQIANAKQSIALAQEDVALQKGELSRIQSLSGRGVSTASTLDAARMAELGSRNKLMELQNGQRLLEAQQARLEQAVKLAEAKLDQARLDLSRTIITAPIEGVVMSGDVEAGGYLRKGDVIAVIDDTTAAEVRISLDMRTLGFLRGQVPPEVAATLGPYDVPPVSATVTYDVLGNTYSWKGQLTRYEGLGINEQTRTVPCRILVNDPRAVSLRSGNAALPVAAPTALVRGMYVQILLHPNPQQAFLSIPEAAVRPGNVVWVVRHGKLYERKLQAARVTHDVVLASPEVTDLKPGEPVVVSPLPGVVEGMDVRVRSAQSGRDSVADDVSPDTAPPVRGTARVAGQEVRR